MAGHYWKIDGAWDRRGLHGAGIIVQAIPYRDLNRLYTTGPLTFLKSLCFASVTIDVFGERRESCFWTLNDDGIVRGGERGQ